MPERKRFLGCYRDATGAEVTFHVDAFDHAGAEAAVEQIGATGRILGELIEEGDGRPFLQMGRA